jgi:hypothetical protein
MVDQATRSPCLQHLDDAVRVLVGAGPVKQRLTEASARHLSEMDPAELPRDLVGNYRTLMGLLTAAPAIGGLGSIEASVRKMSDQDAAGCALKAFELYMALAGRDERDASVPPPRQLRLVGDE